MRRARFGFYQDRRIRRILASVVSVRMCAFVLSFDGFFTTAAFNPASATYDSSLINHSTAYTIAALVSWLEFWLKNFCRHDDGLNWSFPPSHISIGVGLVFTTFGQFARSLAMWTARSNFNHIVQDRKHKGHVLVTSGIYTFLRHPSYVGFFYWSIGTQILLGNPFCIVAYTLASWRFFNQRIRRGGISSHTNISKQWQGSDAHCYRCIKRKSGCSRAHGGSHNSV